MTGLISTTPTRAIPMITRALKRQQSVMLWGPAGCAKSDVARQIAARDFDNHMIDIRLGTTPPENLHLPVPNMTDKCIDWFPTRLLPDVKRDGKNGVFFMDEITSANNANAITGYQIALDRRCGDTIFPDGWAIMAAGNRAADKGITFKMSDPLANRFIHFEFDPMNPATAADWLHDYAAHCAETSANPIVSAFLQFDPSAIYQTPRPGEVAFPTLRSWSMLGRNLDQCEALGQKIDREEITGTIGNVKGAAFQAFLAHRDEVPSFPEIVADPTGARCPTTKNIGACFFVVGMLCHHMSGTNFAQCSKYLKRLPQEIDAAAVGMMSLEKKRDILISRSGQEWLVRVQHILA